MELRFADMEGKVRQSMRDDLERCATGSGLRLDWDTLQETSEVGTWTDEGFTVLDGPAAAMYATHMVFRMTVMGRDD